VKIAVPREITPGEARVALTPAAAARLVAAGHHVYVEAGAGGDPFPDSHYKEAKAELDRTVANFSGFLDLTSAPILPMLFSHLAISPAISFFSASTFVCGAISL